MEQMGSKKADGPDRLCALCFAGELLGGACTVHLAFGGQQERTTAGAAARISLLTRTTRSRTLTSEGRDLHERALRLLRNAEEIKQMAHAARAEPSGALKISAPVTIGVYLLCPALPRFRERYPKLSIDLRLSDQIIDLVEDGVDVAIRVGDPDDSRLISRKLASNRFCVFASP
jgi:DNA-binding transcriptional LysR family regulator